MSIDDVTAAAAAYGKAQYDQGDTDGKASRQPEVDAAAAALAATEATDAAALAATQATDAAALAASQASDQAALTASQQADQAALAALQAKYDAYVAAHPAVTYVPRQLLPADVLDLSVWKINEQDGVTQVSPPQILAYSDANFDAVTAVEFRAYCGGKAWPGSNYAREELREMNPDGTAAAWSTTSGTHTLHLQQRVVALPPVKPVLVIGQVHNETYQLLITLNGKVLTARYQDNLTAATLDTNYTLGKDMDLKIVAGGGFIDVYYSGVLALHQPAALTGCYFKAGAYLGSSTATGDLPGSSGAVQISKLTITHA
jgi:poly(beta-D-mannuronate) lyase